MKVYIVTSGSYSDLRIDGIFSSRKRAQNYINKCELEMKKANKEFYLSGCPSDFNGIEARELNAELKECSYKVWYTSLILDDGSASGEKEGAKQLWGIPKNEIMISEKAPFLSGRSIVRVSSIKSAVHARKLAVEARQKWLREKDLEELL